MLNTKGVSSFNDLITNNTRILARRTCILLYFIHGPPVFSILGEERVEVRTFVDTFIGEAYFQRGREVITFDAPATPHAGVLLSSATDLPDAQDRTTPRLLS